MAVCFLLQECDNLWWDAFTTEFFEDDAMLTITFCLEDGLKRYSKIPGLIFPSLNLVPAAHGSQAVLSFPLSHRQDADPALFPQHF